jgi:hypothetical protein
MEKASGRYRSTGADRMGADVKCTVATVLIWAPKIREAIEDGLEGMEGLTTNPRRSAR